MKKKSRIATVVLLTLSLSTPLRAVQRDQDRSRDRRPPVVTKIVHRVLRALGDITIPPIPAPPPAPKP